MEQSKYSSYSHQVVTDVTGAKIGDTVCVVVVEIVQKVLMIEFEIVVWLLLNINVKAWRARLFYDFPDVVSSIGSTNNNVKYILQ